LKLVAGAAVQLSDGCVPVCLQDLGHTWIDVMKIDVEGSEFAVFEQIARSARPMPFTQIQVEVHQNKVDMRNRKVLELLYNFMSSGLRIFSLEPNIYFAHEKCMEFALMRMDNCGNVVTPVPADA
jgi:hypothetical protein